MANRHTYFAVRRVRGPSWDDSVPMREQVLWDEHAAFMNALVTEGFVVLGGPVAEGGEILLIIDAATEQAVMTRLAADPWSDAGLLAIGKLETWTILLDGRRQ